MNDEYCPLLSIAGDNRYCIRNYCAWFLESKQKCAVLKLAEEAGYIPGYLSQIAHHFDN